MNELECIELTLHRGGVLTCHLYNEHSIPLVVSVRFSGTTCASSTVAMEGCRDNLRVAELVF